MEVIATIGVISSIVQLVDFSSRCLAKGVELQRSATGILDENEAITIVLNHLKSLKDAVLDNDVSDADTTLQHLCRALAEAATELSTALEKVKVKKNPGERARWKSMRKAIRSVWSKAKIQELEHRLEGLRAELSLHITFKTREQLVGLESRLENQFQGSSDFTERVLEAILANRDVFDVKFDKHLGLLESIESSITLCAAGVRDQVKNDIMKASSANELEHSQTRLALKETEERIQDKADNSTNIVIRELKHAEDEVRGTVEVSSSINQEEHAATQAQILELKQALQALSQQIKEQGEQHMRLLAEYNRSKSSKKRKQLGERSNAVAIALLALETMYRTLQSVLAQLQTNAMKALNFKESRDFWNLITYARKTSSNTRPVHVSGSGLDIGENYILSGDLYFLLEYTWIKQHRHLVDLEVMRKRWPSPKDTDADISDHLDTDGKILWLLTAVTAALQSHISTDRAIYWLLKQTFFAAAGWGYSKRISQSKHAVELLPTCLFSASQSPEESNTTLAADLHLWRTLARRRKLKCNSVCSPCTYGSDSADHSSLTQHAPNIFDIDVVHDKHKADLLILLNWLVGSWAVHCSPLLLRIDDDDRASSPAAVLAQCLHNVGLAIEVRNQVDGEEKGLLILSYCEEEDCQYERRFRFAELAAEERELRYRMNRAEV